MTDSPSVAGLDGCKTGWCMVTLLNGNPSKPQFEVIPHISEAIHHPLKPAILAIDMPIGLPEQAIRGGRDVENSVRPHLGNRQSSVFSVPARSAVMEEDYIKACEAALAHSDPPRKVSKQCFNLFPKIREIDAIMTPDLEHLIYEVHPEFAFWRLNDGQAMQSPKKIKSRAHPAGIEDRQVLLAKHGIPPGFFSEPRPKGVGADDRVDATVCALIALRILKGEADAFPPDYKRDGRGLRMAIWA
ncbi:DUF429 domain-containing protein [Coralliovum pocilloporae]|uniref:DUF429 domain-containing protein n=1 Tax=Coralliovum pocilloporae TaxID=3066369 RepID=UPI003306AA10